MPRAKHDDFVDQQIEIEYETFGDADGPPMLLISGLGAQLVSWDEEFCEGLVDRGFFVIRFDNRDVGLTTKIDSDIDVGAALMAAFSGERVQAPYLLKDMARDAIAVLDDLDIERAHVVGASMGGMIAQTVAIEHGDRVQSLTSIMSTTGERDVGGPDGEVMPVLLSLPPSEREAAIDHAVGVTRAISAAEYFDEERARRRATRQYDRCFHPQGPKQQLLAITASGSRATQLPELDVPTLVVHGDADPLVNVSGGERTAELIPDAELLILPGVGHELPLSFWAPVIEAMTTLAVRSN